MLQNFKSVCFKLLFIMSFFISFDLLSEQKLDTHSEIEKLEKEIEEEERLANEVEVRAQKDFEVKWHSYSTQTEEFEKLNNEIRKKKERLEELKRQTN